MKLLKRKLKQINKSMKKKISCSHSNISIIQYVFV